MILRKLIILLLGLLPLMGQAQVHEADSAYMADDYLTAAKLYQQAIDSLGPSAERYYNLGNAYYRAGMHGMAIVSYERALRHDPSNSDIKDNLEFVQAQNTDRITPAGSLIGDALNTLSMKCGGPDFWAMFAMVTFILALAGAGVYFLMEGVTWRKVGFFGGLVMLLLCILGNVLAWRGAAQVLNHNRAIVVAPSVILSTTPRAPKDRTEEAMLLHEGTPVEILDSIPGTGSVPYWYDVQLDDNRRAWAPSPALERL